MTEDGTLYTDPTTGATIFDDGSRMMPPQAADPIVVDEDGRGSVFGDVPEEAAAPAPPPTAAAPALATSPGGDTQAIEQAAAAGYQAATLAQQEGLRLYRDAASRAQRVAVRREEAERSWAEGGVTPQSLTEFITQQETDTRASVHAMGQAQAKMTEAHAYASTAETHAMWAAIKSRFPGIDENHRGLGHLASDLWVRRHASRFGRPYTELLEEHLEGIRSHLGASAPPPATSTPAPVAETEAETSRISVFDARTFGLA